MLRSLKDIEGYTVSATDGDIGNLVNFLLDDEHWRVRFLVVQADNPLFMDSRNLLLPPISFRQADWSTQRLLLALTVDEVKSSLGRDVDEPVSRQQERDYSRHYDFPKFWVYSGLEGTGDYRGLLGPRSWRDAPALPADAPGGPHLRSAAELRGFHIQGSDEEIGHLDDFIVDDESWEIPYLVIDTSNCWIGKKVLVAANRAHQISRLENKVHVDLPRHVIKKSPEWNAGVAINRDYEARHP